MKYEFLITIPNWLLDFHTCNSLQLSGTSAEKTKNINSLMGVLCT